MTGGAKKPTANVSTFDQFMKTPLAQLSPSRGRPSNPQKGDYWTEGGHTIFVCVDDNGTVRRR